MIEANQRLREENEALRVLLRWSAVDLEPRFDRLEQLVGQIRQQLERGTLDRTRLVELLNESAD